MSNINRYVNTWKEWKISVGIEISVGGTVKTKMRFQKNFYKFAI